MAKQQKRSNVRCTRKVLRIPDLEQSKHAVLNSLPAKTSQQSYGHAIDEFISWYCSEPRLAFNRTVVLRYRFFLEQKNLAPSTIKVRLAAVRRLAYEAADRGLLSPELAAGIARVKGAKRLGVRIGNWLTAEQGKALLQGSCSDTLRGKRDCAILAVLLGCCLSPSGVSHSGDFSTPTPTPPRLRSSIASSLVPDWSQILVEPIEALANRVWTGKDAVPAIVDDVLLVFGRSAEAVEDRQLAQFHRE